ncbi:MAG: hypothetical protein DRQ88_13355 [Epsilonproteobacteria bacterium]|nr:MAG: hypothetical protein DRQ89_13485 [Campylobacterota bacterium]RLA62700.1 MAG: hypothetical protein DRQ88_13355 [Campylobacterota bacterium]
MKMRNITGLKAKMELAKRLGRPPEVAIIAKIKVKIILEIIKYIEKKNLTHQEVADMTGIPRSAITGIINGSLQRVSIDRLVRIMAGLGKSVDMKIKDIA